MRLSILQYGDPILRAKGKRIEKIDDRELFWARRSLEPYQQNSGSALTDCLVEMFATTASA